MDTRYQKRKLINGISTVLSGLAVCIGLLGLIWILAALFIKGVLACHELGQVLKR